MGLFDGKKGVILGVANDRSIAWAIAQKVMSEGGECGFSHLPDRPDDERKKMRRRVEKCINGHENAKFLEPLDVRNDEQIAEFVGKTKDAFGKIDFLLHSIAFADRDDLLKDTIRTSREGFKMAVEISAYSLMAVTNAYREIMNPGASVVTMTYYGGEKVVQGYNVMGVCKAALDSCVKYMAYDLGPERIRVNAVSAGPLKTLASSAVGAGEMLKLYEHMSPLGRNITHDEVGNTGAFLLSSMSDGITGEILHVDGGYNIMGSPGRLVEAFKDKVS